MRQGAQGWCTGMTLRDGMGREVGGGFRMGDTCTLMADSCNEWQKTLQYCKVISLHLNKKFFFNLGERTWADTVRNGFKGGASSS